MGKGDAAGSRDTLGHFSSSPFGTGAHRANAIEAGAFPTRTQTRLTERKVLCPSRYQQLPVSVGGQGTEPGAGAARAQLRVRAGTLPRDTARPPRPLAWGQELEPLNHLARALLPPVARARPNRAHQGFPPPSLSQGRKQNLPVLMPAAGAPLPRGSSAVGRSRSCMPRSQQPGGSAWLEGARAELRQGHGCTDTAGHYSSLLLGKNKAETLLGKWELSLSPRLCGQPAVAPRPSPALVGYPKTLLGDGKQRGKRPPCCTHTGKARGKSDRGRGLA